MGMSSERWKEISRSRFPWGRKALDYIRARLPNVDPYRAWANFEFIADDGTINEVDLLIVAPRGFFLIEIKSKPGVLSGDRATWVWAHDGRSYSEDNPIIITNRKAKKLASLLKRQKACQKIRFLYLEPLVFCFNANLVCHLQGVDRYRICLRDQEKTADRPAVSWIIAALKFRKVVGLSEYFEALIDRPMASAISRAMEQAGIRPSQRSRRAGDWVLGRLLFESPTGTYQDWEARHSTFKKMLRWVRIYTTGAGTPAVDKETIRKAVKRELELLEGLNHPGVLQILDYTEHEPGPALIFKHDPEAMRLDHLLGQYGDRLSVDDRLSLIRPVAEALQCAHEKRVVHRALSPQSILVTQPETPARQIKIFNWQTGHRPIGTSTSKGLPLVTPTLHPEQLIQDTSAVYRSLEAPERSPSTTLPSRMPTVLPQAPPPGELPPEVVDGRHFEDKLQRAAPDGTFLALTVAPTGLEASERELMRRFRVVRRNVDDMLIRLMRQQARAANADWKVVLQADAVPKDSPDWRNLMILAGRVIPLLEQELLSPEGMVLLVHPGLLARYDRRDVLERLRDRTTNPGGTGAPIRGLWVLLPSREQNPMPMLDCKPLPVISSLQVISRRRTRNRIGRKPTHKPYRTRLLWMRPEKPQPRTIAKRWHRATKRRRCVNELLMKQNDTPEEELVIVFTALFDVTCGAAGSQA